MITSMNRLTLMALFSGLTFFLFLAGPLQAAPHYVFQDLGVLAGGNQSFAYGVNDPGQVVGAANLSTTGGGTHAFSKDRGQSMQDLGVMAGGYESKANGINSLGQIVGEGDSNGYLRAFLREPGPGQNLQDLGDLGGAVSRALGINNNGQVVGRSDYLNGTATEVRAFLKNPGDTMQNLGTLGGWWSEAAAINNSGQVAGTSLLPQDPEGQAYARAFLKNPTEDMQSLGLTSGASSSFASGLNNAGQVVGYVYDDHPYRAFLKNPGQDMLDLGTLGGACSWAFGINDAGQVAGWADDTAIHSQKAFLWEKGVMYNLNHLTVNLPGNGEWPSVFLAAATAINNRGWIVGTTGTYPPHAFLLTPVAATAPLELLLLD